MTRNSAAASLRPAAGGVRLAGRPPVAPQAIRAEDLTLLGEKAQQNTSTPANPRPADAAAFTAMFTREYSASA